MSWEIVGAVSGLIASVATLLTLVYLSIQIRDSNKLARSASLQSVLGEYLDRNSNNTPELQIIFNHGILSWENLSIPEKIQFNQAMAKIILHLQNIMQLHDNSLISNIDYQTWLGWTTSHIKTPGGADWWKANKISYTPTVVEAVDAFIAENASSPSYTELYPWLYEESLK